MRIEPEIKLDYKDVLFKPKRSTLYSRSDVDLNRKFHFKNSQQSWQGIPIIASNMDSTGTFEIAKVLSEYKLLTCLHKFYTPQEIADFFRKHSLYEYVAITIGIQQEDIDYLDEVIKLSPDIKWICVDIANGYTERFVNCVKIVRQKYPHKIIIAGNVVTSEMVEELILTGGADIVKVGIGPGSVCTTRIQTGVGYPQLSAVIECADAAHGVSGCVVADGGCVIPGDVAKAFGGGADFVMLGGMLAGHDESGGVIEEIDGKKYKSFYGMSSDTAMKKYYGKVATYRSSEGKIVKVPYKGSIHDTIQSILGGVRSTCTYIGARNLKNMPKCTTFIRVSQQSNEVFGKNI